MTADAHAATLDVVCAALRSGDLAPVERVLAPGVRWDGCRSHDEVLATLRAEFAAADGRPVLQAARLAGDCAVLHVAAGGRPVQWFVLRFDAAGLVDELQGYADEATAEHDIALRAAGPPADEPGGRPRGAVSRLVAFVHVADMARSLAFYRRLGLEPVDSYTPGGDVAWACLASDGASLMLAHADAPVDHRAQAVLFYLYSDDLAGLRDQLVAHGIAAGEIRDGTPGPKQEMRVEDPDGYVLMIAQIEDAEAPR